jgi:predicted acylesterase/phospholipase RssA
MIGVGAADVDVVVAGGGSNCVSLGAALFELARTRTVARVAGTSAGGLVALALAFGVDPSRFRNQLEGSLHGNRLLDGGVVTLLRRFGWCRGDELRLAARILVGEGTRLGDAKIPVAVVVSDLYERRPRVLSSWGTPDVLAEDAAVATAAIPGVFAPQQVRGLGVGNRLHADGGIAINFAYDLFDDNPRPTIGLRPSTKPLGPVPVRDVRSVALALGALFMWSSDNAHRSHKSNAVVVDVPAEDGLDFDLEAADVTRRWAAGVLAVRSAVLGRV